MKKPLIMLGMGACVCLAFNSCQSTDGDGYFGSEEAVSMSEFGQMTVADGEIPPWLLEDSGEYQVDAGATTHNPNTFPIPEPEESLADSGGSASAGQRQPEFASNSDVTVETRQDDIIVAPYETATTAPVSSTLATTTTPVTPRETAGTGAIKKPGSPKPTKPRKPAKRVTEPTLVSYKVKPGDNLSEIARRSNTTIAAIRKASGIKGDTIYAGSIIKVPYTPNSYKMAQASRGGKATTHTVKRGESLSKIAARYGISTQELLKANKMSSRQANSIRVGQKLTIPGKRGAAATEASSSGSKGTTHTVKRGESLSKIAARYGISTQELLKANNMSARQANRIHAGQKLTIPGKKKSGQRNRRRR